MVEEFPDVSPLWGARVSVVSPHFYVYAITFDQEMFGIFSTREAAEADLRRQIAGGGPAWADCSVERCRVEGEPEMGRDRLRQALEAVDLFLGDVYAREGEPQDKLLAIRTRVSAALALRPGSEGE